MVARLASWFRPAIACIVALLFKPALARSAEVFIPALAQAKSTSSVVTTSHNYAVEIGVILLLYGGVLYVVCKASRRE